MLTHTAQTQFDIKSRSHTNTDIDLSIKDACFSNCLEMRYTFAFFTPWMIYWLEK